MLARITLTAPEVIKIINGTKAQIVAELCERLSEAIAENYHGQSMGDASSSSSTPASPEKLKDD